jgi:hypothetical protein
MVEYWRRLERTQIKICVLLLILLFGGLLVLPRIGQIVWIAVIMVIHVRVTHVIARREELLEHHLPKGETHERSAWYDARERRIVVSGSDRSWILEADPARMKYTEIDLTLSQNHSRRLPKRTGGFV